MRRILWVLPLLFILTGCPGTTDEEELEALITEDLAHILLPDFPSGEEGDTVMPETKDYIWVFWYREPDPGRHERYLDINVEGDSAFVIITRELWGTFHRFPVDTIPFVRESLEDVPKDLHDKATRYAIFKRTGDPKHRKGWELFALSGIDVKSQDTLTVRVDSFRVEAGNLDTTIKDPLFLWNKDNLLTLFPSDTVTLTVYASDEAMLFLHTRGPEPGTHRRFLIHKIEPGVFQGVWVTAPDTGIHHVAIDAIRYETIWDDEYPYDSNAWLLPYRVE